MILLCEKLDLSYIDLISPGIPKLLCKELKTLRKSREDHDGARGFFTKTMIMQGGFLQSTLKKIGKRIERKVEKENTN